MFFLIKYFASDYLLSLFSTAQVLIFIFAFIFYKALKTLNKWKRLPPGPWGLPFVGYLPFMGQDVLKTFEELGNEYGSVFGFSLGTRYAIVTNDKESLTEALRSRDILGRPERAFYMGPEREHMSQQSEEVWTVERKHAESHFRRLTNVRNEQNLFSITEKEIDIILEKLDNGGESKIFDMRNLFIRPVRSIMHESLWGEPLDEEEPFTYNELIEYEHFVLQQATVAPALNLLFFPFLDTVLRKLSPYVQRQTKFGERYEAFIKNKLDQRYRIHGSKRRSGYIDNYFTDVNDFGRPPHLSEFRLRSNILFLTMAGTDTILSSLLFMLMTLIKHQDIQEKIYQEILVAFGIEGRITWAEKNSLPYTLATIQEGLRYHPIIPINTVRKVLRDTTVKGYFVPKGTLIFANQWSAHNEPNEFNEPEKFIPERYLKEDGSFNYRKPLHTFSTGRRNCPGKNQALIELFLFVTAIIQRFKVLPPDESGVSSAVTPGLVQAPAYPMARFQKRFV